MASRELLNLVSTGILLEEAPDADEIRGLIRSGTARLSDAEIETLTFPSRFDLAYNASHAFALAALRLRGFRARRRYVVFQCLQHTLGVPASVWRVLAKAHGVRNQAEYEGHPVGDERLLNDLLEASRQVCAAVEEQLGLADEVGEEL